MALIESYIINGNILSYAVIQDRIKAMERKEGIRLFDELSPKELLQDVALRLDSTQYVSLEKKNNYSALIGSMINNIKTNISIDQEIKNNFDNLKQYITNNDSEQALSLADQIMISTNDKIKEISID